MRLTPVMERYVLHWGEMGARWGVNRSVAQIHALLYLSPAPLTAEEIADTLALARSNVSTSLRELQSWGLVNDVLGVDELADATVELAREIASNAPLAEQGNKRVIRAVLAAQGALDPETERELIELRRACFLSEDFREGVRAFAEKRPPRWRGR